MFLKYRRDWLHEVTGYSKGYLCRMATGNLPPTHVFMERVSAKLNLPQAELFSPLDIQLGRCGRPCGCSEGSLDQWVAERCQEKHLSLREAAAKTGLSHVTIQSIIKGKQTSPETIRKLAQAFGGDELVQKLLLEDELLELAGLKTPHSETGEVSEAYALLMDKIKQLSEPQLKMLTRFADFITEIERK